MEVTENSFKTELPVVLKAIEDAAFLSFDCEFTGIGEGASMVWPFDTPSLIYVKAKENLGTYTVLQFGLCAFQYDSTIQSFRHRTFNFYIFPRLPEKVARVLRKKANQYQSFNCQADSLHFLSKQNFDFNKWINEGVGFLKKSVADEMKQELESQWSWQTKGDRPTPMEKKIPFAHLGKHNDLLLKVQQFYDSSDKHLTLENLEGFESRLLINAIQIKYGSISLFSIFDLIGAVPTLKLTKCKDSKEFRACLQEHHNSKLKLLDGAAGFCDVITAISKSKKPLVGHNVYLDILQTLKTFCCDLPQTYADFKHTLHNWFPCIFDTKVLCSQPAFKKYVGFSKSLSQLYKRLQQPPFKKVSNEVDGAKYGYNSENMHEAGYDAFLTGMCFLTMATYLNTGSETVTDTNGIQWNLLQSLANKVSAGRVVDLPYIDVSLSQEADMCPDRSHVFHLLFSNDWVNEDIFQLFSPYGTVKIAWIDTKSCFVTLEDRRQSKSVLKNLVNTPKNSNTIRNWKLQLSADYLRQRETHHGQIETKYVSKFESSIRDQSSNNGNNNKSKDGNGSGLGSKNKKIRLKSNSLKS